MSSSGSGAAGSSAPQGRELGAQGSNSTGSQPAGGSSGTRAYGRVSGAITHKHIEVFGSVRVATSRPAHDSTSRPARDEHEQGHGHAHGHGHGHGTSSSCGSENKKPSMPKLNFAPNIPEIDLTNERLPGIPAAVSGLEKLTKLVLRQNHIEVVENLARMRSLRELDLYENKISAVGSGLAQCPALTSLDLSFNLFREIKGLDPLGASLRRLYLIANKITAISGLEELKQLELLELGSNRLRKIQGLARVTRLTELYLGRNKITALEGIAHLSRLRVLSMQSNRVVSLVAPRPLEMPNLEELYLSHNGVERIEGLQGLPNLRVLDLGSNRIKRIEGLEPLLKLRELWLNNNFISSFDDLKCIRARKLKAIYLEQNPIHKDPQYEAKVLKALPTIRQLDAEMWEDSDDAKVELKE